MQCKSSESQPYNAEKMLKNCKPTKNTHKPQNARLDHKITKTGFSPSRTDQKHKKTTICSLLNRRSLIWPMIDRDSKNIIEGQHTDCLPELRKTESRNKKGLWFSYFELNTTQNNWFHIFRIPTFEIYFVDEKKTNNRRECLVKA